MLIANHQDIFQKKILVSIINYANEDEVLNFALHLAKQTIAKDILLTVTANKWTDGKRMWLYEMLNTVDLDITLFDYQKNLGYLNGCLAPYQVLREKMAFHVKWVVISNTDIEFASENFFEILLKQKYADDVGCVAPNVYVPTTGAFENPRYIRRFTRHEIQRRISIFSSIGIISNAYQRLASIKAGRARNEEQESQYVYLAHGCCFAVSDQVADALCEIPYSALLYSEEAYVAEMAIQIGKRIYYDRELKLYHHENAVTGRLKNEQRAKMLADSLSMIYRQFYAKRAEEGQLQKSDVCATIVAYNDVGNIEYNVSKLCNENVTVIIIDNGSNVETLSHLERIKEKFGIVLLHNEENLGIAAALQQGLEFAYKNKFRFYLTLDQDSKVCDGMVQELLRVLQHDSTIASVGPAYCPQNISATAQKPRYVDYLITSGSMTRTNVAICIGGYDETLFIDGVDFDFSLNLRQNGYQVAVAPGAHLNHKIGEITKVHTLFGDIDLSSHSPLRYYYMARNHDILKKKYGHAFRLFFAKKDFFMAMEILKVKVFFPEKDRYLLAIKKGRKDAMNSTLGKCIEDFGWEGGKWICREQS